MVLVKALDKLHAKVSQLKQISKGLKFPKVQVVVTGKGPQKDHYLEIFEQRNKESWDGLINIKTAWLTVDDYPKIVASADLGVCLHYSSSGLDLPMKVVDMFSAQLPCLAYNYLCIEELVEEGKNGRLFDNAEQLSEQLFDTLKGF
jgi:beta-1,4-mannosyltransferase